MKCLYEVEEHYDYLDPSVAHRLVNILKTFTLTSFIYMQNASSLRIVPLTALLCHLLAGNDDQPLETCLTGLQHVLYVLTDWEVLDGCQSARSGAR